MELDKLNKLEKYDKDQILNMVWEYLESLKYGEVIIQSHDTYVNIDVKNRNRMRVFRRK